jgi:hypothetical protein
LTCFFYLLRIKSLKYLLIFEHTIFQISSTSPLIFVCDFIYLNLDISCWANLWNCQNLNELLNATLFMVNAMVITRKKSYQKIYYQNLFLLFYKADLMIYHFYWSIYSLFKVNETFLLTYFTSNLYSFLTSLLVSKSF